MNIFTGACSIVAIAISLSNPAAAQVSPASSSGSKGTAAEDGDTAPDNQIADIVVTAQRRSERLQDVPIAVTAFTADKLGAVGIQSTQDLAVATPGLTIGAAAGYVQPRVRGIGTTSSGAGVENPVATYVDGVYIASAPASIFSLSGVERVEIIKGPQGTLFGRNATGGLIQVITRDPGTQLEGDVRLAYGNYQTLTADAYVGGPLSDNLGGSLTLHSSTMGKGYGTNVFNGQDTARIDNDLAVRGKIVARIGEANITVSGDYNELLASNPSGTIIPGERNIFGIAPPVDRWDIDTDIQPKLESRSGGGSVTVEVPLPFARLLSITAYRRATFRIKFDGDNSPITAQDFVLSQRDRQFSQEIQLASNPGSSVNWVLGAFYFDAKASANPVLINLGGVVSAAANGVTELRTFADEGTKSYAGFGQITVPLGDRTKLTGGIRYTSEKRTQDAVQTVVIGSAGPFPAGPPLVDDARFNKLTFRAAVDHKVTDDVLAYASFNRGFKSGGFNSYSPSDAAYLPEFLDAYEVGVKSDLLDRRLRLNMSGFYYDYANIQVQEYSASGLPNIRNGAKARIYGLDVDATAAIGNRLQLTGGLSLIHDRFTSFPNAAINTPVPGGASVTTVGSVKGNRLPQTPDWTANLAATYTIPLATGNIKLDANYQHSDGWFGEPDNTRRQKPYDLIGGSVTWNVDETGLSISVWGRNLANEAVANQLVASALASSATYQPPRTYGGTLAFTF